MDDATLPAKILLYITSATAIVGILVNGIRTAIALPAIVAFLGACVLGFAFVVLFQVANGELMTPPLWAASVIAGVMVGGAAAGSNAVHSRSKPTEPTLEETPPPDTDALAEAVVARIREEMSGTAPVTVAQSGHRHDEIPPAEPERVRVVPGGRG